MEVNVIVDTREKHPLVFTDPYINSVISKKLDTGDYSVEGYEDTLFIERKGSLSEFYGNITQKRFWAELERARTFPYRFIVVEFDMEDIAMFPHGMGLSKQKMAMLKLNSKFILSAVTRIMVDYDIKFVFTGNPDNCAKIVERIIKHVCEETKKSKYSERN